MIEHHRQSHLQGAAEFNIEGLGATMIVIIVLASIALILIIGWIITAVTKDAKMYKLVLDLQ